MLKERQHETGACDSNSLKKEPFRSNDIIDTHHPGSAALLQLLSREVAWYPPDNFDQASYLLETYRLQENIFAHGLGQVWKAFSSGGHAAGVLFPIEGALAGIIIGGARLPQLAVLFISFCALQIAAFATARTIWKDRFYGYIALGLTLSQITLWYPQGGGLFDFRMDFLNLLFLRRLGLRF